MSYEERRESVISKFNMLEQQVVDSAGGRWVKCNGCGRIETPEKFISYGGKGPEINYGCCRECSIKANIEFLKQRKEYLNKAELRRQEKEKAEEALKLEYIEIGKQLAYIELGRLNG